MRSLRRYSSQLPPWLEVFFHSSTPSKLFFSDSLASIDSRDRSVFQSFLEKTAKKSLLPDADPVNLDSNMEV